ncbi:MAG: hypothetical protein KF837_28610 [Labilithrix sp.]|nr:hypothetical protein [Labilithrix sp.]
MSRALAMAALEVVGAIVAVAAFAGLAVAPEDERGRARDEGGRVEGDAATRGRSRRGGGGTLDV